MKKQTKAMSLKKQLMSAVSMMLVATVALGSSTYAWFVNRSRAEVKDVLFQATAGKNLEIAGAVIEDGKVDLLKTETLKTAGDQVAQSKANLLTYYSSATPQQLGARSFTYPQYTNGSPVVAGQYMTPLSTVKENINLIDKENTFFEAAAWDSELTNGTTAVGGYSTYTKVTENTDKKYICAQLYFRSSQDMDVYLNKAEWENYVGTEDTNVGSSTLPPFITYYNPEADVNDTQLVAMHKAEANDLASALRIAFVVGGKITDDGNIDNSGTNNAESKILTQFTTRSIGDAATYNTKDINNSGKNITSDTPIASGTPKEPGSQEYNIASYGSALAADDTIEKYAISGNAGLESKETNVDAQVTGKSPLFHVTGGVPKRVTIYIWLEGTDKDCVSALASYRAGIYLPFVGVITNSSGEHVTYDLGGSGQQVGVPVGGVTMPQDEVEEQEPAIIEED